MDYCFTGFVFIPFCVFCLQWWEKKSLLNINISSVPLIGTHHVLILVSEDQHGLAMDLILY